MILPLLPNSVAVNLRRIFPSASFVGCGDIRASAATDDSVDCRPGVLFAAIRGHRSDGHQFITQALENGAAALLVERPQAGASVPQCIVPNSRRAYAELCAAIKGDPSKHLGIAGVTGTNGKTTITWLIRAILRSAGRQTGVLGTIEYSDGTRTARSTLTTPDPEDLAAWLGTMVRRRTTHAAMELSSHALEQDRAAGIQLDVAILSNITQDHFDYHQNFESYRASKLRIFDRLKRGGLAVVNVDDAGSGSCRDSVCGNCITYGLDRPADVTARILEESLAGSQFQLRMNGCRADVQTRLVGRHNVSNCLAAAAAASHLGIPLDQIARGIETLAMVPGRLEAVECGQPYSILVDYAHTPDALRRCITGLRQLTAGRVICVFGAGGDRDRLKRPLLGQAAAGADMAVLTSDNPRTEDPWQIMQDVLTGLPANARQPHIESDRVEAIQWALSQAQPGDCVLVAGKGHETEQIYGTERRHFDDREVVREAFFSTSLRRRGARREVRV